MKNKHTYTPSICNEITSRLYNYASEIDIYHIKNTETTSTGQWSVAKLYVDDLSGSSRICTHAHCI